MVLYVGQPLPKPRDDWLLKSNSFLKLRKVMEVLCVSTMNALDQKNEWGLASSLSEVFDLKTIDAETTLLLQYLSSIFNIEHKSPAEAVQLLDGKLKDEPLSGEHLARHISGLLLTLLRRLLQEAFTNLVAVGHDDFIKLDSMRREGKDLPFAICALGSLSLQQACPYSDIEIIAVANDEHSSLVKPLQILLRLVQLKMVCFGETPVPDSPKEMPRGFHLDTKIGEALLDGESDAHIFA